MYFMKQDLCTIIEDNLKFIQQYPVDELILKLKLVAIAYTQCGSSSKADSIMNTKDYIIRYNDSRVTKIIIIEESPNWDSVKIELDGLNLLIKEQNGHSYYENVAVIPLRVIRMFNE